MTSTKSFKRFQILNLQTNFLSSENIFRKTGVRLECKSANIENITFLYITAQKQMLRQIEWEV